MLATITLCPVAQASIYWLDNHLDPARPHYRTPAQACYLGVMEPQIRSYRSSETNPSVRFRVRAMYVGPEQGLGERVCRGDIEKTYSGFWVTTAVIDTLVYGPNGSADACNLPNYTDPDTGQCGPPKCTDKCCDSGCGNGSNPIQTASGNKHQVETDYVGSGPFPLRFERTYNSNRTYDNDPAPTGVGWSHTYSARVIGIGTGGGGLSRAVVERPDGRVLKFTLSGGTWHSDPDVSERLDWSHDGAGTPESWTYTTDDDAVETYDAEGRLTSITSREGFTQTLSYTDSANHPADRVQMVTGPTGRTLSFGYDSSGRLTNLTDGNGEVIQYAYDTHGNLETVTYPDVNSGTTTRTYYYNESGQTGGANLPHALTGIRDENNDRFASWGYTAQGRANLSVHGPYVGGTIDRTSLTFNANGTTTVTDGMGQARVFGFGVKYLVARMTALDEPCDYCGTHFTSRSFDSNGYPDDGTDFRGFQTDFTYDARGLETGRVEAVGENEERTTNTSWDPNFRVPTRRTVVNHSAVTEERTDWVYNGRGQPVARCEYDLTEPGASGYACAATGSVPVGLRRWVTTYCDAVDLSAPDPVGSTGEDLSKGCPLVGLVRRIDGPRGDVDDFVTYEYYLADDTASTPAWRKGDPKRIIDALGHVTEYLAYDGAGRLLRSKDANGVLTDSTWHPRGWLRSRTVRALVNGSPSPDDATTSMTWDGVGNLTNLEQPDGVSMTYTYDNAHRLTNITDDLGNHIDYTLDALGHRTAEKTFDVANSTTPTRLLTRTWNTLSRLEHEYDAQLRDTAYGYDGNGNRTDRTDPLGVKTHWTYDGLDRLASQVGDYQGTDPDTADATTGYQYDTRDNLTQVTDPELLATHYAFDGLNDLIQLQSPDTGTSDYPDYDAAGNRLTQTDARNVTWNYAYDALNRLTGISYPTAGLDVDYRYDGYPGSSPCAATSYPVGRLTGFSDSSGSTTYCYDRRGNITEKIQITGAYRFDTRYAWNLADRLTGITYPSGAEVSYTRDAAGRIDTVSATPPGGSATTILNSLTWLPFGPVKTWPFATGGQTLHKSYDQNYWLTDVTSNVLNLHFCRDAMRNITDLAAASPACHAAPVESYTYDNLYRLTGVEDGSSTTLQSFTYNLTGDRQSKTISPQPAQIYSYTPGTHHLSAVDSDLRDYDDNGNTTRITGGTTLDFTFDDRNRMTEVKRNTVPAANYDYNARGERVYKSTSYLANDSRRFAYAEDGRLLGEYTATAIQEYVWANGTPVALLTTSGQSLPVADRIFANGFDPAPTVTADLRYIHSDQLDSPRAVTSTTGTVLWSWAWQTNPFGEVAASGTVALNLRFPGQYADLESALNYNYFRDYEPSTGRYIESDPIGLIGGVATYDYTGTSPLIAGDAFGASYLFPGPKPDYTPCAYYDKMYAQTQCCYYHLAARTCRGKNALVNFWLWVNKVGNGQSNCIRPCLIKEDKKALKDCHCRFGSSGVCNKPGCVNAYHNKCYSQCGAPKIAYGGNIVSLKMTVQLEPCN